MFCQIVKNYTQHRLEMLELFNFEQYALWTLRVKHNFVLMPRPKSPYPYLLKHSHLHAWANHGTCFRQMLLSLLPIFPPFLYSHCQKWRSYTLLYFPNKHTDYWNKHRFHQNSKLRTNVLNSFEQKVCCLCLLWASLQSLQRFYYQAFFRA